MSNKYLDGSQVNLLKSKPDLNCNQGLTQSTYVSAEELDDSKYDAAVLPKSDVQSPRDEFPNFYTNMNNDLELQGYYFAKHEEKGDQQPQPSNLQEKIESSDIDPYQATDLDEKTNNTSTNLSNSTAINASSNSIKPYEANNAAYEYNSSSSEGAASHKQTGGYEEENDDTVNGYGGYELDALARAVLHRSEKENSGKEADTQRDEEDLEVLNSITAFEEIINSEDNSDQKNLSNETQENIANINLFYNTEFRRLMSLPDSVKKFEQLGQLANDFVYNAETYGRIIISERTLPHESKTVKPTAMGGQAGGEKFVVRGILFKYAVDTTFAYRATPFWMYGGSTPDDERASKAGGHELLGCANIMNCNIPDLNTPLMALIDYKGYRLVAMSFLPISKGSLVYGSSDAGKTIHNDAPPVVPLMRKVGKKIELVRAPCGQQKNRWSR
jgi:hypothetical protein